MKTKEGPSAAAPAQDQHAGGGEHAAVAEDDADLRVTDLGGGLAAQLADAYLMANMPYIPVWV